MPEVGATLERVGVEARHAGQREDLRGLPMPELGAALERVGVEARHAGRVFRAIHTLDLPISAIRNLGERRAGRIVEGTRIATATVASSHPSPDGTERLIMALEDGARVESVLIPMREGRRTLCVSTQVGCGMACSFCATGTLGLTRGLSAGEIVAQVAAARRVATGQGEAVTHIVFMGMGEPLHHYGATRDALRVLLDQRAPRLKARHVTVSTVGIVPRMSSFADDFGGRVQLAISLHAGTDATRCRLIPAARTWDLAALKEACAAMPLPGRRCLMIEYVVLPGVNDGPDDLAGLVEWTRGLRAIVNLIPFNPFAGAAFRTPTDDEVRRVEDHLRAHEVPVSVRWPRGRAVTGACGQLMLADATPT